MPINYSQNNQRKTLNPQGNLNKPKQKREIPVFKISVAILIILILIMIYMFIKSFNIEFKINNSDSPFRKALKGIANTVIPGGNSEINQDIGNQTNNISTNNNQLQIINNSSNTTIPTPPEPTGIPLVDMFNQASYDLGLADQDLITNETDIPVDQPDLGSGGSL
jgi:hypothetical protein